MEKVIINEDPENLGLIATEYFFNEIKRISDEKGEVYLGLSEGKENRTFYPEILEVADFLDESYWKKIKFVLLHEDSFESTYNVLKETFFSKLIERNKISEEQIIKVDFNEKEPNLIYSKQVPYVDITVLGVGEDGHVASLLPEHSLIEDESEGFIKLEDKKISISKNMLSKATTTFIFFVGENRKDAFKRFNKQAAQIRRCPAKLAKEAENTYVLSTIKT